MTVTTTAASEETAQKHVAGALDIAADRSHCVEREPATRRQCWYLAHLCEERGITAAGLGYGYEHTHAVLTKGRASALIDMLLKENI